MVGCLLQIDAKHLVLSAVCVAEQNAAWSPVKAVACLTVSYGSVEHVVW